MITPQGWTIELTIAWPEYLGWEFWHENYCGAPDSDTRHLCGGGINWTRQDCLDAIAEIEAEHEYFRKEIE